MSAIVVDGLVKDFGPRTRALDGLELEVAAGEVHGFLGPNGAGKTTTIRVLLGMLRADAGRVEGDGRVAERIAERRPHLDGGADPVAQQQGRPGRGRRG